jgi:trimethylamine--corrinoid protein Co-methyltransferase
MASDRPPIEPIRTKYRVQFLTDEQLDKMQEATLHVLENTGVKFPSEKALKVFEEHGGKVDRETSVVKIPRDLVMEAMSTVPRFFQVGARHPAYDFKLEDGVTYFTTDGCGVEVVDLKTREIRPSRKEDVGMMARVVDYLSSMAFYWPIVSAQDYGKAAPLHELDASWNNTVKHVQSETLMGEVPARYAIEMGTVIAGDAEKLRKAPVFSVIICTIAPLVQDKEGIEGAMLLAEAGIPVGFLAMPTMGTTAPATVAGAYVVADAEIISATVLLQLAVPGAPVSHSVMQAWADPRTGGYVPYPLDARSRYGPVSMAHHWGMSSFGGAFGTESPEPGTWQSAADVALDPLLIGLAGCDWVTGIGLNRNFTRLYPEAIIYDDQLYHHARYALAEYDVNPESIALDVIEQVGPGGHYLSQKHTRKYMRTAMVPGLTHQLTPDGKYRDVHEVAREKLTWILDNHQPEPLPEDQQTELAKILKSAEKELNGR